MMITVDIKPEVQAELARQAAAQGRPLEAHAASLLEEAAHISSRPSPGALLTSEESRAATAANLIDLFAPVRGLLTDEEVDALFSRNPSAGRPVDLA